LLISGYEPLAPVVDHKISLSKGGPHTIENCCAAHWACNARKHNAPFTADCAEVAEVVLPDVVAAPVAAAEGQDGEGTDGQLTGRGRPRINTGPCCVPGCGRPTWVKQLCRAHYHRLNRYGDPLKGVCSCGCAEAVTVDPSWVGLFYIDGHGINTIAVPLAERLRQSVIAQPVSQRGRVYYDLADDCLIWTGPQNPQGYGRMYLKEPGRKRKGRSLLGHLGRRLLYVCVKFQTAGLRRARAM
jgi:HNH endonuclease